jgi:hypothetical protein
MNGSVKAQSVTVLKQQEARSRMSAKMQAGRNPRSMGRLQRRASLVGGAAKWKIVNLEQSFAAMAKWATPNR